ncbi:MAG: T9SS type A sorting domain-containing protein [Ignavibacteriales bacterium]|nr:T9SS type A sorting domain-containing protein [Ignavibacteriales bacterium]
MKPILLIFFISFQISAQLNPDYIFYSSGAVGGSDADVYQMLDDGTNSSLIYDDNGDCNSIQISSDASKLLFSSTASTTTKKEVFIMYSGSNTATQITSNNDTYGSACGRFYGSNKIWYDRGPSAGVHEWWEMNYDGTGQVQKTNWQASSKQSASFDFNSDKSKVVYEKGSPSSAPSHEIYVANIDLTNELQITSNGGWDGQPRFSPDGSKLVWTGDWNIWTSPSNSASPVKITDVSSGHYASCPVFSRDGQYIYYTYSNGTQYDIYRMNTDGTNKTNITNTNDFNEYPYCVGDKFIIYDTLVAYYPFNGNANDSSGNGNHGNPSEVVFAEDGTRQVAQFTSASYIEIPDNSSLDFSSAEGLTIAFWIKHTQSESCDILRKMGLGSTEDDEYAIEIQEFTGKLVFRLNSPGGYYEWLLSRSSLILNNWNHAVFMWNKSDSTISFYINGIIDTTTHSLITSIQNTNVPLRIGHALQSYLNSFIGSLDNLRFYNRSLSDSEILDLYNGEMLSNIYDDFVSILPKDYKLFQNYPNPFNPSTKISYEIPNTASVNIKILNILGQEIVTLVNEEKPAGHYEVEFNASNLTSGIYLYRLKTGDFVETKKMVLLK